MTLQLLTTRPAAPSLLRRSREHRARAIENAKKIRWLYTVVIPGRLLSLRNEERPLWLPQGSKVTNEERTNFGRDRALLIESDAHGPRALHSEVKVTRLKRASKP